MTMYYRTRRYERTSGCGRRGRSECYEMRRYKPKRTYEMMRRYRKARTYERMRLKKG